MEGRPGNFLIPFRIINNVTPAAKLYLVKIEKTWVTVFATMEDYGEWNVSSGLNLYPPITHGNT